MDKSLFAILLGGVLLNNYALQSFLGVTTFLGASKDTKKATVMGIAVTIVMTLSGFLTWLVNNFVLAAFGLEYLQTLVFVAIILAVAYLVGAAAKAVSKKCLGVWFPLVALNSAVLGVTLNNVAEGYSLLQALVFVAIILAVAYLVGAAAKAVSKKCLGVWFPLVALNSAVLGVTLNNVAEGYSLLQALVSSVAVGLGFLLAMVVFCGVRSKIEEQYVPKAFRGLPIHLMAASILALALFAF